ncbi:hypothetical protein HSR121_2392 [Halapricum desulfuricans]|uniref:Uncharacterized protein n=1 Tax=Halapricum desulfuricans TaxID=2841257 RepID=A0A897N678_9EURY|nr:hypothetical protein HSR121_2392 [Halapricum desulfuricans]
MSDEQTIEWAPAAFLIRTRTYKTCDGIRRETVSRVLSMGRSDERYREQIAGTDRQTESASG